MVCANVVFMPVVTNLRPGEFPVLLFDGDCGFCTATVAWLERWVQPRAPIIAWQFADLAALGVRVADCRTSIQWVRVRGDVVAESAATAAVLHTGRPPWPLVGRLISLPGIRQLADLGYRWVARNRYRLPGSTPACQIAGAGAVRVRR